MNADLVARSCVVVVVVVGRAALVFGALSITFAVYVALAGLVVDSVLAVPSTLQSCVRAAVNSFDAMQEASLRRIRDVAGLAVRCVLCCGGAIGAASAAAASAGIVVPSTIHPESAFESVVVVSAVAFAAYAAIELVGIVASSLVAAAAAAFKQVLTAAPSALKTCGDRMDGVLVFEFVVLPSAAWKWAFATRVTKPKPVVSTKVVDAVAPQKCVVPESVVPEPVVPAKVHEVAPKKKKSVSFGKVQVQEYNVKLGDHPCCKRYPMTLGWSHTEPKEYELDAYGNGKSGKAYEPLEPRDRRNRIAQVAGVCPSVVQEKEHRRRQKPVGGAPKPEATTPATPREKVKKSVSFGKVQVQEYSLTLGDHPCCASYPLSMDWGHTQAKEYDLDLLQQAKSAVPRPDLSPEERLARIANVAGVCPSVVQQEERHRRWMVVAESRPSRRGGDGRR